tara:strand:- start:5638 stop:6222 length:585 start_codon:yes stop_codon:yes gene_type:complete
VIRSTVIGVCCVLALPIFAQEIAPVETCDYGTPHPSAPEEISQFEFLIGDYTIHLHAWTGQGWTPPQPGVTARWNGRYGLGGMAIVDEWFHPDPAQNSNAPRGINVRMYDEEAAEWDMMWVATGAHQVQDLRAKMQEGRLTMWQVYPERNDFLAKFEVYDEDHWARIEYQKSEDGEWVERFKLAASRIDCEASD